MGICHGLMVSSSLSIGRPARLLLSIIAGRLTEAGNRLDCDMARVVVIDFGEEGFDEHYFKPGLLRTSYDSEMWTIHSIG